MRWARAWVIGHKFNPLSPFGNNSLCLPNSLALPRLQRYHFIKKSGQNIIDPWHFRKIDVLLCRLSQERLSGVCCLHLTPPPPPLLSYYGFCLIQLHVQPCTRLLSWLKNKRVRGHIRIESAPDVATRLQTLQYGITTAELAFKFHPSVSGSCPAHFQVRTKVNS